MQRGSRGPPRIIVEVALSQVLGKSFFAEIAGDIVEAKIQDVVDQKG